MSIVSDSNSLLFVTSEELSNLTVLTHISGDEVTIKLCLPYNDTIFGFSDHLNLFKLSDQSIHYRTLVEITAYYSSPNNDNYVTLSKEELTEIINKTIILFDTIITQYSAYDSVIRNLSLLKIRLQRSMGNIVNDNNHYRVDYPIKTRSYHTRMIINNTFFRDFINHAYSEYENIIANYDNSDEYYAQLLIGLYCSHMDDKSTNSLNNGFSLNIIKNGAFYTHVDFPTVVHHIMGEYDSLIHSYELFGLINMSNFVRKLYYHSTIDSTVLELLESKISSIYSLPCISFEESDENLIIDGKITKSEKDFSQPENMKIWGGILARKIQRLDSLITKNNHPIFEKITIDYPDFINTAKLTNVNNALYHIWCEHLNIMSSERIINNLSDNIIDFLYSDSILNYYNSYRNNVHPTIIKEFHNHMIDTSHIESTFLMTDNKLDYMLPFIISKANDYFNLNINHNSISNYYRFYVENHLYSDSTNRELSKHLFYMMIINIDNKKRIEEFLDTYRIIYDYYKDLDCENYYKVYYIEEMMKVINSIPPDQVELLKNNAISVNHFLNIMK